MVHLKYGLWGKKLSIGQIHSNVFKKETGDVFRANGLRCWSLAKCFFTTLRLSHPVYFRLWPYFVGNVVE